MSTSHQIVLQQFRIFEARAVSLYYYPSASSRAATILVGQASTPAAGLQTRSRFMFAACRYVGQALGLRRPPRPPL
jgi:hypothetical protein